MKYSLTAVAVASLATTTFAAAVHNHANAHKHQERAAEPAAEAEPEPTNYTFSDGQCWGPGNGCNAKTGAPPAASAPPAAPTNYAPPQVKAQAAPTYGGAPAPAPAPVQSAASQATSAAGSVASSVSTGGSLSVDSFIQQVNQANSQNNEKMLPPVSDGSCSEGTDHPNVIDVTNKSGDDFLWVCWGAAGSWLNVHAPIMAHPIPNGQTATLSYANTAPYGKGGACTATFTSSAIHNGQINNTWFEYTYSGDATVDVSREVNMFGTSITAKTATGCTTSMDTCVFKCSNGVGGFQGPGFCGEQDPITKAYDYELMNCPTDGTANVDPHNGGCKFGTDKTSITVGPVSGSY